MEVASVTTLAQRRHNQIAAKRMRPKLNTVDNADGTFEQGSDDRPAELCRFEHAGDGYRSHCRSDHRAAAQRPVGRARPARKFRLNAPCRLRPGESALA